MKNKLYTEIQSRCAKGQKSLAVLIDPDKLDSPAQVRHTVRQCVECKVDYIFVGGSLITTPFMGQVITEVKQMCGIPVVIFPGNSMHIEPEADALLFLALISGRNPELLIGQHVVAAPVLKRSQLEVLSTGYILVSAGNETTVSYMSNTSPVPRDKESVAACTAIAGEMLGMRLIYLDAGSGALHPVPYKMVRMVKKSIDIPLIVGGGLNSTAKALEALEAGADMLVIGNGIEKDPDLLVRVSEKVLAYNKRLEVH